MMTNQITPPKVPAIATGTARDEPVKPRPGISTARSSNRIDINPVPSSMSQARSDGRCAAHEPGINARANPTNVASTHAAARKGGSVGRLKAMVMKGMPIAKGTAQMAHTCHQAGGR